MANSPVWHAAGGNTRTEGRMTAGSHSSLSFFRSPVVYLSLNLADLGVSSAASSRLGLCGVLTVITLFQPRTK